MYIVWYGGCEFGGFRNQKTHTQSFRSVLFVLLIESSSSEYSEWFCVENVLGYIDDDDDRITNENSKIFIHKMKWMKRVCTHLDYINDDDDDQLSM